MSDTIYSVSLTTDGNGLNGFTLVQTIAIAALTLPAYGIGKMRVSFQAGSTEGLTITNAFVGHKATSGNAWDFLSTPVQLTWAGATSKVISANTIEVTDWCNFAFNKINDLSIAYYMGGGAGSDMIRYVTGLGANLHNYQKVANEAGSVVKSAGYSDNSGLNDGVQKVEVDIGFGVQAIFF